MKRLRVDMEELAFAFEKGNWEISYFLDLETGMVELVTRDTRHMLDQIYETQRGDAGIDIDAALAQRDLVPWMKEFLQAAHRIETGFGSRYLHVPESDSLEGYADMKAFIELLEAEDAPFAARLWSAIQGKGAFHRFKDALASQPAVQQRWFAFKETQMRARVTDWLASHGIEAEETGK